MKKISVLCMILAAVCCLVFAASKDVNPLPAGVHSGKVISTPTPAPVPVAKDVVKVDAKVAAPVAEPTAKVEKVDDEAVRNAAKDRYYELLGRVDNGVATSGEISEIRDLCQVYFFDLPMSLRPVEREPLDTGTGDCTAPTVIPSCPYYDTGTLDGDNDCSIPAASPYNEVFYTFTPANSGLYQFRVKLTSGTSTWVPAIRVMSVSCCTGGTSVAFASSQIATDCWNIYGGALETVNWVVYSRASLVAGTQYWIHVGTSTSTAALTPTYEFQMECFGCPLNTSAIPKVDCANAFLLNYPADSALDNGSLTTPDWYKFVIPDDHGATIYDTVMVFVGGREFGHCISGLYNGGTGPIDGRFYLYASDCVTQAGVYGYDEGCSYDARKSYCLASGTYYIKANCHSDSNYVIRVDRRACVYTPPPPNDACAGAITVAIPSATPGSTAMAALDTPPLCVYTPTAPGVWYKVVGNDHFITADICISSFDNRMNVYSGDCANLVCVDGDDDDCDAPNAAGAKVTWCAALGVDYYILVHGYSTNTGTFTLTITDGTSCALGACCYPDGTCQEMTEGDCIALGNVFKGFGVPCDPNPCPQPCLWPNMDVEPDNDVCATAPRIYCGDTCAALFL